MLVDFGHSVLIKGHQNDKIVKKHKDDVKKHKEGNNRKSIVRYAPSINMFFALKLIISLKFFAYMQSI